MNPKLHLLAVLPCASLMTALPLAAQTDQKPPASTATRNSPSTQPKTTTPTSAKKTPAGETQAASGPTARSAAPATGTAVDDQTVQRTPEGPATTLQNQQAAKTEADTPNVNGPSQPRQSENPAAPTRTNADGATADQPEKRSVQDTTPQGPKVPLASLFNITGFADVQWNTDPGYDVFDDDDVGTNPGISVEFDMFDLSPSSTLAVQLAFSTGGVAEGSLGAEVFDQASLQAEHYALGLVPRYSILPWLEAHARIQGGVSDIYTEFDMFDGAMDQNDLSPFGAAGAGLAILSTPKRTHDTRKYFNSLAFGGMVEGGYRLASSVSYAFDDASVDPPEQRIRVQGADLGTLDRSGPYVRLGVFVRF